MELREANRLLDEVLAKRQALYDIALQEGRGLTTSEKAKDERLEAQAQTLRDGIDRLRGITRERQGDPQRNWWDGLEVRGMETAAGDRQRYRSMDGPFKTFGEQLQAVARAGMPGQAPDVRLFDVESRAAGLSEGVPSEGGFLVQEDYTDRLIGSVYETGLLAGRCLRYTVSERSNKIKVPGIDESSRATGSRYGGVRIYNLDEAGEKLSSKPKFRQIELTLRKKIGLCYSTDELIQDAALLEQVVTESFRQEMAFTLDDEIINGTGAGQFLGILNAPCLVTVSKEAGQPADTLLYENLLKMVARYNGSMSRGLWLANRDIIPALFQMAIAIGVGGELVFRPGDVNRGQPPVLLGFPVVWMEQSATLGTVGDLVLADPGAYAIGDKASAVETAVSMHVRFIYDETAFRFVYRCDGQPIYASAVTPYKGAGGGDDTQSPFVALETRD